MIGGPEYRQEELRDLERPGVAGRGAAGVGVDRLPGAAFKALESDARHARAARV